MAWATLAVSLTGLALAADGPQTQQGQRFEVLAWVDHFDFAGPKSGDHYIFDTEVPEGWAKILDHVQETGATTILWRNCGGATMRYDSAIEAHHHPLVPDKRRVPLTRMPYGWVHYGDGPQDTIAGVVQLCRQRGLIPGVHWPFEETHWAGWTIGGWNLEHPQYWGRTPDGQPWWGRTSLGFDEVMHHKLALVDELVSRGITVLFIDFYRNGGWSPTYEYVEPVVTAYRAKYHEEPPSDPADPRWCRHVASYVTDFLRQVRKHLDASGRKIRLLVGLPAIAPINDRLLITHAADWQHWVADGFLDGLVINYVCWDAKRPFESTRDLCRQVMKTVGGRCPVYWPVRAYDFSGYGMPSYHKATGLPQDEVAARLMKMAWEEGAAGISLECVDYGNYSQATRRALKALAEGECKWARSEPK